ncbi:hypothetical protein ABT168_03685 [Streptomyces sp. NPDC001793]|uniref:hypothetical protein n=1 Tax=Streptomyces sp. NPDC001793 TaxID=3154657 RepID=UPI003333BFD3
MPDPNDAPGSSPPEGDAEQQAYDAVRAVTLWYSARITAERRAPAPDERRIRELTAARRAALDDGAQLATADPEEAARVAAYYMARLRELTEG